MPTLISQPVIEHFIRSRLYWFGKVARHDIVSVFEVGTAYASRLLSAARKTLPVRDVGKSMMMSPDEQDMPEGVSSHRFLSDLYCAALLRSDPTITVGADIPHMAMDAFLRHVPESVLRPLVRTLQQGGVLEIEYIGMSVGDQVKVRTIEPLRLVHVGGRWHVNAHCQTAGAKRDFVLSRILSVRVVDRVIAANPMVDFAQDGSEMHAFVAHPALSPEQKEVVWREFAMENGRLEVYLSNSELFYFEQQYVAASQDEAPPFKLLVKADSSD